MSQCVGTWIRQIWIWPVPQEAESCHLQFENIFVPQISINITQKWPTHPLIFVGVVCYIFALEATGRNHCKGKWFRLQIACGLMVLRAIRSCLILSGAIWSCLDLCGAIWSSLALSNPIWSYLVLSGSIWCYLVGPWIQVLWVLLLVVFVVINGWPENHRTIIGKWLFGKL